MKAIVFRNYGPADLLRFEEVERPVVGDDEVLVRVRAAAVNPMDWRFMRGEPYAIRIATGLGKPKTERLGADFAGEVETVGRNVTRFKVGDAVFGAVGLKPGAFAEHACAKEDALAPKPANLTFEQAAAVPVAALTALQGLRDSGRIQPGEKVLINGAAGGVGTFAVQLAKAFGAEVTGVCSGRNVDLVRSIGADHVVDYTRADFTAGSPRYDLVFDAIGNRSLSDVRRVIAPKGTYVVVGGPGGRWIGPFAAILKPVLLSPFVSQRLVAAMSKESRDDLMVLKELIEAGKVRPVIDCSYSLAEVPQALRYLEEGHARGKVVIAVA